MKPITAYTFTRQADRTILVVGGAADYTIVPDPQGARCTCPAGTYRGRCKHLARASEIFNDVALAPLATRPKDEPADALSVAITQETTAVVNRCEEQLAALEVRASPGAIMRKYRAARERVAAGRAS